MISLCKLIRRNFIKTAFKMDNTLKNTTNTCNFINNNTNIDNKKNDNNNDNNGRYLFESLGCPRRIVAPMVDQSELGFRLYARKYGAELCYTPMLHAKQFANDKKYRLRNWVVGWDGSHEKGDRPLIVQFCANDPDELLSAAMIIANENSADAIDINFGCPQDIARRGHYGAFLMDDWDIIYSLISKLNKNLPNNLPVTAKIRIYNDKEKTLNYAKMVLKAGAKFLTVHGRTREMRGQNTGLADWEIIKFLRENLPKDTVIIGNGNILYPGDVEKMISFTGVDAVMSAEGVLSNPAVLESYENLSENESESLSKNFIDKYYPRVDIALLDYLNTTMSVPGTISFVAIKSHVFGLLSTFLEHHTDLRARIGKTKASLDLKNYDPWLAIAKEVQEIVQDILQDEEMSKLDKIVLNNSPFPPYKSIPYWRCQPYFRPVNGSKPNVPKKKNSLKTDDLKESNSKKRVCEIG